MENVLQKLSEKISNPVSSRSDIILILAAKNSGNWDVVYASNLYNNHSTEYCVLLEILNLYPVNELWRSSNEKWSITFWNDVNMYQLNVYDGYTNYEAFRYNNGEIAYDRDGVPDYVQSAVVKVFNCIYDAHEE